MDVIDNPPEQQPPLLDAVGGDAEVMVSHVPHARAIGMRLCLARRAYGRVAVPYQKQLIGNPETGVIHGGVVTTALDSVMGLAVFCALTRMMTIATMDLRIDYMRPAEPGLELLAEAYCYKVTRAVAFVRGTAFHAGQEPNPVGASVATFMLTPDGGGHGPDSEEAS